MPRPRTPVSRTRRRTLRRRGFTLIELLVVLAIIGLLATVVVINVLPSQDTARVEKAKADLALLEQALELYRLDHGGYPSVDQGLRALVEPPAGLAQPERYRPGGYIRRLPDDPWGRPYRYLAPGRSTPFELGSLGSDGREGGSGDAADIGFGR